MTNEQIEKRKEEDDVFAELVGVFEGRQLMMDALDDDEFCNWYLKQVNYNKTDREKVAEMSAVMLREIDAREKALQYVHGQDFRNRVGNKIKQQPGKKKSVNFLMGTAGFRAGRESLAVNDMERLAKWLHQKDNEELALECVNDVKLTETTIKILWATIGEIWSQAVAGVRKTPLIKYLKQTGDTPEGCELMAPQESFYPWTKTPALPMPDDKPKLEATE